MMSERLKTRRDVLSLAAIGATLLYVPQDALGAAAATVCGASFRRIAGYAGSYGSAIFINPYKLMIFSSATPRAGADGVVGYVGPSFAQPKSNSLVLPNSLVTDMVGAQITRVCVVYSAKDKTFYGVVYVSKGYPPSDGRVFPAFVSSPTGLAGSWVYHGQFGGEVGHLFPAATWGSGMSLIVNDGAGALDPAHPSQNKFVFYADAFGPQLALLYSADGLSWNFYRNPAGAIAELLPVVLKGEQAIFPSAVRTPSGWHMYYTNSWPPKWHRHLVSQDGVAWSLHGTLAQTEFGSGVKNVNLAYNQFENRVYAMPTIFTGNVYPKNYSWFNV